MSLQPEALGAIPEDTARTARKAFPQGNIYLRLRDEFGTIYHDEDFAHLFSKTGQPALSPWRLALVTIIQFRENLTDRQASDAVRARIDLKYLLGLELTDPGFDYSVLSEFRQRLLSGQAEQLLLDKVLSIFKDKGWLKARGKQRTDSTHVLASVRVLNRLELVAETLRAALNELATEAPDWVRGVAQTEWFKRYSRRFEEYRLPKGAKAKDALAFLIAEDGFTLMAALDAKNTPEGLADLPSVTTLRLAWSRHFALEEGKPRWQTAKEMFESEGRLESPFDPEARFSQKAGVQWVGYKLHLTETCDDDDVHLISDVRTTPSVTQDVACTDAIQDSLVSKGIPPAEHFLDAGYVDAELLCSSKDKGMTLVGPPRKDKSWQHRTPGGYDHSKFAIDWDNQQVTCPHGKQSRSWKPRANRLGHPCITVYVRQEDCSACPSKMLCTKGKARGLQFHPRERHQALQAAREFLETDSGRVAYSRRAGIEGTLSQGIRSFGLRKSRYRGLAKTSLQHVATAAAVNLSRAFDWLEEVPRAKTRTSRLAALAA